MYLAYLLLSKYLSQAAFSLSEINNEQSMAQMPVLFHKDNIISFLLGKRLGMRLAGVSGGVSKMHPKS